MNESSSYTGKYTHTFTATAYTGKYTHTLTQQQRWIHLEIFIILGQQKDAHHNHTRDNFTHTQSSWSLGWQEIKNTQQRELSKTKSDKIKASHILGLHTTHGAVCPQRAAHCRFIHKKQLRTPIHRCIHTAIYFQGTRAKPLYKAVWMDLKRHS